MTTIFLKNEKINWLALIYMINALSCSNVFTRIVDTQTKMVLKIKKKCTYFIIKSTNKLTY